MGETVVEGFGGGGEEGGVGAGDFVAGVDGPEGGEVVDSWDCLGGCYVSIGFKLMSVIRRLASW